MKSTFFTALCIGITIFTCNFIACRKDSRSVAANTPSATSHRLALRNYYDSTDTAHSKFISMSVANTMISSYLASINASTNDSDVTSFTINADSLREYLAVSGIKNVKLILAHTTAYMNQGNYGVNAGYQAGALTIIIAGYDSAGNYVYYNGNVLDHAAPCPFTCPPGQAGNTSLE